MIWESVIVKQLIDVCSLIVFICAFPPELWLDWFADEMHLIALPSQKTYVAELFEKAVKDYMS